MEKNETPNARWKMADDRASQQYPADMNGEQPRGNHTGSKEDNSNQSQVGNNNGQSRTASVKAGISQTQQLQTHNAFKVLDGLEENQECNIEAPEEEGHTKIVGTSLRW